MNNYQLQSHENSGADMLSELSPEQLKTIFVLRMTILFSLMIAAMNVLDGFISLFFYALYLGGTITAEAHPEEFEALQTFAASPFYYLTLDLYNIVLWNLVIICSMWLWRYYIWARKTLKTLLGLDMLVTVFLLLWLAWKGELQFQNPGWMISVNTIQVLAIITLSHPRIVEITEQLSPRRSSLFTPGDSSNDSEGEG